MSDRALTTRDIAEANGALAALRDLRGEIVDSKTKARDLVRQRMPAVESLTIQPFDYVLKAIDDRISAIEELLGEAIG